MNKILSNFGFPIWISMVKTLFLFWVLMLYHLFNFVTRYVCIVLAPKFLQHHMHATSSTWKMCHKFCIMRHKDSTLVEFFTYPTPILFSLCTRTCEDHMHIKSSNINIIIITIVVSKWLIVVEVSSELANFLWFPCFL